MKRPVTLKRLSICPCGYPALKDGIDLGAAYLIDDSTIENGFGYQCGRCGQIQRRITCVETSQRDVPGFRLLPLALFEDPERVQ